MEFRELLTQLEKQGSNKLNSNMQCWREQLSEAECVVNALCGVSVCGQFVSVSVYRVVTCIFV
jgi:hypothetical protein